MKQPRIRPPEYHLSMSPFFRLGALSLLALSSCMTGSFSSVVHRELAHPISGIAMDPGGGLLADAVALELFNNGLTVHDTAQTRGLLVRMDLSEVEVVRPTNLEALRVEGIDAYIVVRMAAGSDGRPDSASVRVTSTHDGTIISGFSWQNGWGGKAGSLADRSMRTNVAGAAKKIGRKLAEQLGLPPDSRDAD